MWPGIYFPVDSEDHERIPAGAHGLSLHMNAMLDGC